MAPPANRRTGYSRRAQYTTFLAYVAGAVGVLVGGLVLVGSITTHSTFSALRMLATDITTPAARLVVSARNATSEIADTAGGFITSGSETARLRREVALARVRLVETHALADENRRLKAQLQLAGGTPKPVANGWLISATNTSTRRYAAISAGRLSGVAPGMPVRTALGLVGRVLEADSESVVPVRRASDGIPAFATGSADGTLRLRLLSLGIKPLKPGDGFVTSGAGGIYWPGTPIAVVTQLTHDGAIARVLSDPAASEIATVQPAFDPVADPSLAAVAGPPAKPTKPAKPAKHKK